MDFGTNGFLAYKSARFVAFYLWTEVKMKMYSGKKQDEAVVSF